MAPIPQIIHQIWFGIDEPLPEHFALLVNTWKENNPSWEYILWDTNKIEKFFLENYPDLKYKELQSIVQYFIIQRFGGVYIRMDFECIEPIDSLLSGKGCCLSYSSQSCSEIADSFIACTPDHPFINYILDEYIENYLKNIWNQSFTSLTKLYYQYNLKAEVTIFSYKYIIPCSKKEIDKYKSGDISEEEMESKLSDAVAFCYFFLDRAKLYGTDILYASTGNRGGGAYRAAYRIHSGLLSVGLKSKMLVLYSGFLMRDDIMVASYVGNTNVNWIEAESPLLSGYKVKRQILFSPSAVGIDFKKYVHLVNPKIVQLHFINLGFIAIEGLKDINVPIVWRLADCWAFTGGCHYFGDCDRYTNSCGKCPLLNSSSDSDPSHQIWCRKKKNWENLDLTVVVPSQWMKELVQKSSLMHHLPIEIIPNGLDIDLFKPLDKVATRKIFGLPLDGEIILYGAAQAVSDPRKGFALLKKALENIEKHKKNYILAIFGAEPADMPDINELSQSLRIPIKLLGVIKEHLILQMAYSAADVMVAPSIEEAFGQTVIEAMACATPVIAFEGTGPASIIDHKQNGYLAKYKDSEDLSNGIEWVLSDAERRYLLSRNARSKVENVYDIRLIGEQYKILYEKILDRKKNVSYSGN